MAIDFAALDKEEEAAATKTGGASRPSAAYVSAAGPPAGVPAAGSAEESDGFSFDKQLFDAGLIGDAAKDLIKAPLAGLEKAGRGIVETGRAALGALGVETPALPPPYVEDSKAFPAQILETATQFGIGIAAGGVITKATGLAAKLGGVGSVADDVVGQGIATYLVADPYAPTIGNLVEQFPLLRNPVTEFLSSHAEDGGAMAKLRASLGDMMAQAPLSLLVKSLTAVKASAKGDTALVGKMQAELAQDTAGGAEKVVPEAAAAVSHPQIVEGADHLPTLKPEQQKVITDLIAEHPEKTFSLRQGKDGQVRAFENVVVTKNLEGKPTFYMTKDDIAQFDAQATARYRGSNTEGFEAAEQELYGRINFSHIDSPQTVKQLQMDISNLYDNSLKTASAKNKDVITEQAAVEAADLMGTNPGQAMATARALSGSADKLTGALLFTRGMVQSIGARMLSLGTKINTEAHTMEDVQNLVRLQGVFTEFFGHQRSLQSGAARATQSGNIGTDALGKFQLDNIAKLIEEGGGIDGIKNFAKRLALAKTAKEAIAVGNASFLRKVLDSHNEFWINGILSGVKTHIVNLTSNTINTLAQPFNLIVGGALRRDSAAIADGIAMYHGLMTQAWDSAKLAGRAFASDTAILDPGDTAKEALARRAITSANYNLDPEKFLGYGIDFLGRVIRFPGRFLTAEDEFFKQINYRAKLKVDASREAETAIAAGKMERSAAAGYVEDRFQAALNPNNQNQKALQYAQQATFTQRLNSIETWSGGRSWGAGLQTLSSNHPVLRGTILPFIKVPTNILRSFQDHSLLAPLTKRFHTDFAAGGEQANMAVGKLATGTLLTLGAVGLAMSGRITGAAYGDKDMQARARETGWQPYSLRVAGADGRDYYVALSRLDPWGMMLGLVGDFYQTAHHIEDGDRHNFATAMSLAVANNIASKSYLQGLVEISSLLGSGYHKEHSVERFIQQRVGSYVPAYTNLWSGNEEMKQLRTWYDGALAKMPWYSDTVEARRDYLTGEKSVAPDGHPWNAINPFTVSPAKHNPVRDELKRLTLSSAESKFVPPSTKLGTLDLTTVKNTAGQSAYDRWMQLSGSVTIGGKNFEQALAGLMDTDRYKNGTDGSYLYIGSRPTQVKVVQSRYQDQAQRQMLKEYAHDAVDSNGAPVNLQQAARTDMQNTVRMRVGKPDPQKLSAVSNLQ